MPACFTFGQPPLAVAQKVSGSWLSHANALSSCDRNQAFGALLGTPFRPYQGTLAAIDWEARTVAISFPDDCYSADVPMELVHRLGFGDTGSCEGVLQAEEKSSAGAGSGGPAKKRKKKQAPLFLDQMQDIESLVFDPPVAEEAVPLPERLLVTSMWSLCRSEKILKGHEKDVESM